MSLYTNQGPRAGAEGASAHDALPLPPSPLRLEVAPAKLAEESTTALTLHFSELPAWFQTEVGLEVFRSKGQTGAELILPHSVGMDERWIVFHYKPLEPKTRLLADLSGALPWKAEPVLVVALVKQLAEHLERSSDWPSPPRFRGSVTRRSVFLSPDGQVRLLGGGPRTRHLVLEGHHASDVLQWAAPEVLRDGPTRKGEVHTLAALAYELLSGTPLRRALGEAELMTLLAEGKPPALAPLPEPNGGTVGLLLTRALSPAPDKRPEGPRAFAGELARAFGITLEDAALRDRLASRLRGLPQNPARVGLSALVSRSKAAKAQGRDPGAALAAWGATLSNDPKAPLPRGHSSGIEPIPLAPTPKTELRPSAPSSIEPEPYRLEERAPPPAERRPSMDEVLLARQRRRRIKWLAVAFFVLLVSAIAHQTLDLPLASWLHERLAPVERPEPEEL